MLSLLRLQATDLARQMVTRYGMSDKLGQVSIDYDDNGRSLSSETRQVVESEVRRQLSMLLPAERAGCVQAAQGANATLLLCMHAFATYPRLYLRQPADLAVYRIVPIVLSGVM